MVTLQTDFDGSGIRQQNPPGGMSENGQFQFSEHDDSDKPATLV